MSQSGYLYISVILDSGMTKGVFLGTLLIVVAIIGICSILKSGLSGISLAAILSAIGLAALTFAPLLGFSIFNKR